MWPCICWLDPRLLESSRLFPLFFWLWSISFYFLMRAFPPFFLHWGISLNSLIFLSSLRKIWLICVPFYEIQFHSSLFIAKHHPRDIRNMTSGLWIVCFVWGLWGAWVWVLWKLEKKVDCFSILSSFIERDVKSLISIGRVGIGGGVLNLELFECSLFWVWLQRETWRVVCYLGWIGNP